MTRVGFVRNDRCLELQRLVNLTELSPDPDCMMFVKDLIMEGRKRGIGVRHKLTQLEVLGEVYAQFHITCHQREWKIQDSAATNRFLDFYGAKDQSNRASTAEATSGVRQRANNYALAISI